MPFTLRGEPNDSDQGARNSWLPWSRDDIKDAAMKIAMDIAIRVATPIIEKAKNNVVPIIKDEAGDYFGQLVLSIGKTMLDNHNPDYLRAIASDPAAASEYASQRADEILKTYHLLIHPSKAASEAVKNGYEFSLRAVTYYQSLDKGRKMGHGARAFADRGVEHIGDAMSSFLFVWLAVSTPSNKRKTRLMMDRLFPTSEMYGRFFRHPVPRFFFSKQLARGLALPKFFIPYMTYREAVMLGQNVESRDEIQQKDPVLARSLAKSRRDMLTPTEHNAFIESIARTSQVNRIAPAPSDVPVQTDDNAFDQRSAARMFPALRE